MCGWQEMKGRARKIIWGMATEEGMRREFRDSNERKKAEKDGTKACAIAEQSKVGFSFIICNLIHCRNNRHPVVIISPIYRTEGPHQGVCFLTIK